jgi:Ni,Fe-hydrogenase I cytochrome b subunit
LVKKPLNQNERGDSDMDFFTGMAFWGIVVLVIVNAYLVKRTDVVIHQEGEGGGDKETPGGTPRCAG